MPFCGSFPPDTTALLALKPITDERLLALRRRDPVERAQSYVDGVVSGEIPASRMVRLAVRREHGTAWRLDPDEVRRVVGFIEHLPHVKGVLARQYICLEPWQCWILAQLFGVVAVDGSGERLYRTAYIEVPRKNAKTTLAAAIGLVMMLIDGEYGAECYSAASHEDQAAISYRTARRMCIEAPGLRDAFGIKILGGATYSGVLTTPADGSEFRPLPRDTHGSLDGLNPSYALLDEVHTYQTPDVIDALRLGMGSRSRPLLLAITTAGYGLSGVGHSMSRAADRVLSGELDMPRHFCSVWTIDGEDDPFSEAAWRKANPNYGVSVTPSFMEDAASEARASPDKQRAFMTKNLNVWLGADATWLNVAAFHARCRAVSWEELDGCPVWLGMDLAESGDMTALAYVAHLEGELVVKCRVYAPATPIAENAQWRMWEADGHLEAHHRRNGAAIDQDAIFSQIKEDARSMDVRAVVYDPWHASHMADRLEEEGFRTIKMVQGPRNFSRPMKELAASISSGDVAFDDNPVLTWHMTNVVALRNRLGAMHPAKGHADDKIDAAVASLMAFSLASIEAGDDEPSGVIDLSVLGGEGGEGGKTGSN